MDENMNTNPSPSPNQASPNPTNNSFQQILNAPLSVGQWVGTLLLLAIPLVNLILLLIWAFDGGTNVNKKNFSRAYLILMLVGIGVGILLGIAIVALAGAAAYESMKYY